MKKVLFATTALFATAGFAAAEITMNGEANMGIKHVEGAAEETQLHYEIDINVVGVTQTDGGLELGASVDLDAEVDSDTGGTSNNDVKDPEVYVSGSFGKVTVGGLDPATDDLGMGDLGFDGIGIDDVAEGLPIGDRDGDGDDDSLGMVLGTANAKYAHSFGDFSFAITTHTITEDVSLYGKYDNGDYNFALGYAREDNFLGMGESVDSWTLSGGANVNDIAVSATFTSASDGDDSFESYGLSAGYNFNDVLVEVAFADNDAADDPAYGIGAEYDLGGSATLAGAIGSVNDNMAADLGVSFKF